MAVKQVLIHREGVVVEDTPAPTVAPGTILVSTEYSCISPGTELASVGAAATSLAQRVLRQPQNVAKAVQMARELGVRRAVRRIQGRLASGMAMGYSLAGRVIEVGPGVEEFGAGDLVACAGAGVANHAEIVNVPLNLAVRVPAGVPAQHAATVALGAIAMQGIRRVAPTLGETVLVVGLGVLGQLTVQLLKASGCRVIGVDPDVERLTMAQALGLDHALDPNRDAYVESVHRLAGGTGADAAIITAASSRDDVISLAMQACRKKARVVVVGDVSLNLKREDLYRKELDVLISTSYGPGRYDPNYEEGGQDYPLAYVRWTEKRNMEEYLRLLGEHKIDLAAVRTETFDVEQAAAAYQSFTASEQRPLLALLRYPAPAQPGARTIRVAAVRAAARKRIRTAVIGAGGFAQSMHLPNLMRLQDRFELRTVVSRTSANALNVARQYEATYASTDYAEALADPEVDLVIISTRHNLHASLTLAALRAGKHVFVEKPLATAAADLAAIEDFYAGNGAAPLLMTGFNRRFAPPIRYIKEVLANRTAPLMINYQMNAGYLPLQHWVHGEEGGGRNIGEACHIYDLFGYLTQSTPTSVQAVSISKPPPAYARSDNFVATIGFQDGSVCTLTYSALGNSGHPKERMNVYADGKVIVLDDFKSVNVIGGNHRGWKSSTPAKGQLEELEALGDCIARGEAWPISLAEQVQATRMSFEIEDQIRG